MKSSKCKRCITLEKLNKYLEDLLVCYRVGKNPGRLLDKISDTRKKLEEIK